MIKRLLKSKTIKGILIAAVGVLIEHGREIMTPELMAEYGTFIKLAAVILETSGLGTAVYGRVKAQGPLNAPVIGDANPDGDIGR